MSTEERIQITKAMEDEEAEVCENCDNVYRVELLKKGDDWNDFGYRYCPFCGLMTDELTGVSSF